MKIQNPEESKLEFTFADGSWRRVSELETVYVGKGEYKPGWRWSEHVGKQGGKSSARHIGYVLSGSFGISDSKGNESTVSEGQAFEVGSNHDAWVIGNQPCIALDFEIK